MEPAAEYYYCYYSNQITRWFCKRSVSPEQLPMWRIATALLLCSLCTSPTLLFPKGFQNIDCNFLEPQLGPWPRWDFIFAKTGRIFPKYRYVIKREVVCVLTQTVLYTNTVKKYSRVILVPGLVGFFFNVKPNPLQRS